MLNFHNLIAFSKSSIFFSFPQNEKIGYLNNIVSKIGHFNYFLIAKKGWTVQSKYFAQLK